MIIHCCFYAQVVNRDWLTLCLQALARTQVLGSFNRGHTVVAVSMTQFHKLAAPTSASELQHLEAASDRCLPRIARSNWHQAPRPTTHSNTTNVSAIKSQRLLATLVSMHLVSAFGTDSMRMLPVSTSRAELQVVDSRHALSSNSNRLIRPAKADLPLRPHANLTSSLRTRCSNSSNNARRLPLRDKLMRTVRVWSLSIACASSMIFRVPSPET